MFQYVLCYVFNVFFVGFLYKSVCTQTNLISVTQKKIRPIVWIKSTNVHFLKIVHFWKFVLINLKIGIMHFQKILRRFSPRCFCSKTIKKYECALFKNSALLKSVLAFFSVQTFFGNLNVLWGLSHRYTNL